MKIVVASLALALCTSGAAASSVHTCPRNGSMAPLLRGSIPADGAESWTVHLPPGEISMSISGTTLFCNYEGMFLSTEIGPKCVLGGNGGKITRQRTSTYCTSQGTVLDNKLDCFAACE